MKQCVRLLPLVALGAFAAVLSAAAPAPAAAYPSAAALVASAEKATLAASSVTIASDIHLSGLAETIRISGRWPNRVRIDVSANNEVESLVIHSRTLEVEGNALLWEHAGLSATQAIGFAGKWYATGVGDPAFGTDLASLNPKVFERKLFGELKLSPGVGVRPAFVAGRAALKLAGAGAAIYVAASGTPYLLRFSASSSGASETTSFSGFGASTRFRLPAVVGQFDAAFAAAKTASASAAG